MSKQVFYVWGFHSVDQMLCNNPQDALEILLTNDKQSDRLDRIKHRCELVGLKYQLNSQRALDKLSDGARNQGIVARRRSPADRALEPVLEKVLQNKKIPLFLALDQIQDPQNLGACLRVADAAGVDGLIMVRGGAAPLNGVVSQVASGAMDAVPIIQCANLSRALKTIREAGIWTVGTQDRAETHYCDIDLRMPLCFVLGTEGAGMRQLTAKSCDFVVSIPMAGVVGSLNVGTAAAVCLFEARRQRQISE